MKKCIIFISTLFILLSLQLSVFAKNYGNYYPSYLPSPGLIYIDCMTSLGRGCLILNQSYSENSSISCAVNGGLFNNTSSTINCYFIRQNNGNYYYIRFPYLSYPQYRVDSSSSFGQYDYFDLNVTTIYNTNYNFKDYSGSDSQNDNAYFTIFDKSILIFLCIDTLLLSIIMFTGFKSE